MAHLFQMFIQFLLGNFQGSTFLFCIQAHDDFELIFSVELFLCALFSCKVSSRSLLFVRLPNSIWCLSRASWNHLFSSDAFFPLFFQLPSFFDQSFSCLLSPWFSWYCCTFIHESKLLHTGDLYLPLSAVQTFCSLSLSGQVNFLPSFELSNSRYLWSCINTICWFYSVNTIPTALYCIFPTRLVAFSNLFENYLLISFPSHHYSFTFPPAIHSFFNSCTILPYDLVSIAFSESLQQVKQHQSQSMSPIFSPVSCVSTPAHILSIIASCPFPVAIVQVQNSESLNKVCDVKLVRTVRCHMRKRVVWIQELHWSSSSNIKNAWTVKNFENNTEKSHVG